MNEKTKQTVQLQINKLKNLPALAETNVRILEAVNDSEIQIDKLAEVLSLSPGVVARLLGLANSAYFGQPEQINELRTAIVHVLGLDLVKSLALGIVLNVHLDTQKCRSFNSEYFWMRSLFTAVAGQKIAVLNPVQRFPASTIYTSGLLLNIGILVAAYLFPEELNGILLRCQKERVSVGDEIRLYFEQSQFQIGHALLQKWHLPPVYRNVLIGFNADRCTGDEEPLIRLLKAGQRISAMVLDETKQDKAELEPLAVRLSLTPESLISVFEDLCEHRQNIQILAAVLSS